MSRYLVQISYTPESWATQLKNPQNRIEIVKPVVEKLGGRFEAAYYSFGDYDLIYIVDFPDNKSAAASSLAFAAGGALRAVKTTPLLTIEEGIEALRKAGPAASVYKPAR